jgi:uncharacterized radical SAM protein YgiQ
VTDFLPTTEQDLKKRGWKQLDVILISGDAYVDHPSYGTAVIGRVLESQGHKVGIIAQPDWRSVKDFLKLGKPKLFFGITSGNTDSMVANYTANKRPRKADDYSPGDKAGLRPDRAVIVYTNRVKEAFEEPPVVIGGIEASLRRLAHYDYWDNNIRRSILLDSKADILVYGMGERQIVEIAKRLSTGEDINSLNDIRGTVVVRKQPTFLKEYAALPSFEDIKDDKDKFNLAFRLVYENMNPFTAKPLAQKHQDRYAIQLPPALPLNTSELDKIYELSYERNWHPAYNKHAGINGFKTVRFSIISHRGCCGECSFCSLYFHQGKIIQSRSKESILKEAKIISRGKDFKGTITDIGGPTANLYQVNCFKWQKEGFCKDKGCLSPAKCKSLKLGYNQSLELYKKIRQIPGVKHVFIESGFRYDLLIEDYAQKYLENLCKFYISGQMKVAPEHCEDTVLKIMRKPRFVLYEKFISKFNRINKGLDKRTYLVNYFISAHPGSGLKDALKLALYLIKMKMHPQQIQDFIPLPMTLAGCIYYTEKDPLTGERVYVARTFRERKMQRALIQYRNPNNKTLIKEALKQLRVSHLLKKFA